MSNDLNKKGTLSQVINRLRMEDGYEEDFNMLDEHLELKSTDERFSADNFVVDEVFRFEGASNPDDNAILYAISTTSGRKGVLVDGYGYSGGQVSDDMLKKLDLKKNRPVN